ncbi:hypothetical protein JCM18237_25930 [Halorubrum luteum]
MRPVARNLLVVIALVLVALLALGALPSYLGSGDPYHLTVESIETDEPAANVDDVSERRYPYLTGALESDDGRSEGYRMGPYGIKEWFTHTPFDEVDALTQQVPEAGTDDGVRVEFDGETYYAEVTQAET